MKLIMILVVVFFVNNAWSSDENTDSCVYHGQRYYETRLCDMFRKEQAEDDARAKEREEHLKQARIEEAKAAAEEEKRQAAIEEARKIREAENARKIEETRLMLEKEERKEAELEASKKHKCGKDYMKPRIGMTLARAEQCIGEFTLVSQINRKDGIISTYAYDYFYINVMGGKIVSWHND